MTYTEFVNDFITNKKIGEPIYSSEVAHELSKAFSLPLDKATAATAVALNRIENSNKVCLRTFQKGIFYITEKTPFGEVGIDINRLINDKYLNENQGYETGLSFMNKIGLTTQIPNSTEIVTNIARNGTRYDNKLKVTIHPPKEKINKDNKLYLQLLDVIGCIDKTPVDIDSLYKFVANYIKKMNLDYQKLLHYCYDYYGINVLKNLAHVASEGIKM